MENAEGATSDYEQVKVAIVGAACKFPGGSNNPELFFQNLLSGRNYASKIPMDRWSLDKFSNASDSAGKAYVEFGHFLHDYDYRGFDAEFFNLSPREVEFLDPQQRMLLELSWEALESAGLDPEQMAGSETGVFVGGFTVDHLLNQLGAGARDTIGSHSAAGATLTMLSNRISYAFDFHGPSFSLDTACSSSLVAFAQAVSAIESSQCETALVGGVNFMLRPEYTIAMSKGRFLAKDGRSKSFDSRADGYGRGEGGGVVVLKSLAAAERDGDPILAVVEGVGVNQDGRTSGITVPNPSAQRDLMKKVLSTSGCDAGGVNYVEAHGTGTGVGDPLETKAIAEVYGRDNDCCVGSVKASIGHLEAAAGIASVIKSVMMLRNNMVPPVAGLETVNPAIPERIFLPRSPVPLAADGQSARIAINSFGYGGTNAHVILSGRPGLNRRNGAADGLSGGQRLLPVSARDADALRARAAQFAALLASDEVALDDVLFTASNRRAQLSHRLAVWGDSRQALREALQQYLEGELPPGASLGERASSGDKRIAFVYTGMGPQWHGMGRELYEQNAIFRATLQEADAVFSQIAGFSILEEMLKDEEHSEIKRTDYAQPGNLMVQLGLTAALAAEGVTPDAVVGHSVGEVASAWASGMLTLEETLLVSCQRSRIQATTAGQGKMLALGVGEATAAELIAPYAGKVSLAAINSPASVTVAGAADCLDAILASAIEQKLFARMLDVAVPYHSPVMEQLKPELRRQLSVLDPAEARTALYSTVTGGRVGHAADARRFDAKYWCDNVREPVHFAAAIRSMLADGYTTFVEIGPHPVLRRAIEEVFQEQGADAREVATLWMNKPEGLSVHQAVADIYTAGGGIDWQRREGAGRLIDLPAYPWQRKPLWRESLWQANDRTHEQLDPLHGHDGADLNLSRLNYLDDHKVDGVAIMPAAGFLEALCESARERWPQLDAQSGWSLRNIEILEALILDRERALHLSVAFDDFTNEAKLLASDSLSEREAVVHARAQLFPLTVKAVPQLGEQAFETFDGEAVDSAQLYRELGELSLQYGPAFQSIVGLKRNRTRGEALVLLERPEMAGEDSSMYVLHPSLLDGCFQSAIALLEPADGAYLPVSIDALQVFTAAPERMLCKVKIVEKSAAQIQVDFALADESGAVFAVVKRLTCAALRGASGPDRFPKGDYQRRWNEQPALETVDPNVTALAVIASPVDTLADALTEVSASVGIPCQRYSMEELHDLSILASASHIAYIAWSGLDPEWDPTGQGNAAELLALVQGLNSAGYNGKLRVVTRASSAVVEGDQVIPAQTAIAGFARVARNELEAQDIAIVDINRLSTDETFGQAQSLFVEIINAATIDEIAIRDSRRYAVELTRSAALESASAVQVEDVTATPVSLVIAGNEISARVLSAIPRLRDSEYRLRIDRLARQQGNEAMMAVCATVLECGAGTTRFSVGERVAGLLPYRLDSQQVVSEPEALLVSAAAAAPDVLQASHAIVEVQAVLLEHACDGVAGAEVLVDDSALGGALGRRFERAGARVTRFAQFDAAAQQRFDLIAGPLAQWSRTLGFSTLEEGGQLVDLCSKRLSFALPSHCGRLVRVVSDLAGLQKSQSYAAALDSVIREAAGGRLPKAAEWTLQALLDQGQGASAPGEWQELLLSAGQAPFAAMGPDVPAFSATGSYLVTGGFGGLGAEVARWLAEHGAGHIALVSRRGGATPGADLLIRDLEQAGASVSTHAVDMAQAGAVAELVQSLCRDAAPLKGIFHAAGVLDDQLLADMPPEALARVMAVKAGGARILHETLESLPVELEHFVLFSSIANLVGNSRQGNYCAANGYLDGLAHLRRARGLPALSVNFGAIAAVGMLEEDARIGQHLTQIGLAPLHVGTALRGLGRALVQGQTQIAIAEQVAWERWAAYETVGGNSPAFAKLVAESREAANGDASLVAQLHQAVKSSPEAEGKAVLQNLIADVIAMVLKTSAERLKPDLAFDAFGVDSLMSTEIQINLDQAIGISYSVVELLGHATINGLVDKAFAEITEA
ncbi:MAG: SDR family NAD(P)-dependent oxidoreductase [Oceanospirillaceae bacterium]|nr:SDR family NAD(P)-dependent oxidoreductase [Oceanospirillaceae bacterium]